MAMAMTTAKVRMVIDYGVVMIVWWWVVKGIVMGDREKVGRLCWCCSDGVDGGIPSGERGLSF